MTAIPGRVLAATLGLVIGGSSIASACDGTALRINVEWLKDNNPGDYATIKKECSQIGGDYSHMQSLIDAYKDGQSHNPDAQATIDGCEVADIITFACG